MSNKLKLLLLAANSVDTVDPKASEEIRAIDRAIQVAPLRENFEIQKEPALRVSDIGPLLLKYNPDVLHISGHSRETEGLVIEDDLGDRAEIQCAQLKDVLFSAGKNLQMVFLGFCHSADCAKELSTRIDFVLGIEGEILVESSLAFAPAFYAALASGSSIEQAVAYGKSILGLEKREGAETLVLHVSDGADATRSLVDVSARTGELKSISQRDPVLPGIAPPPPPRIFIGREDALHDIKRLLMTNRRGVNEENITVVRGWPGVGKTSVVSAIGHDHEIANVFKDGVLWISLEQKPNIISEMARWGRALGSEEILKAPTVSDATAQLTALLSRREMLLIVDDVWDTGHAAAFTDAAGELCSVMVTTRITQIAEDLTTGKNQTYNLPVLTEDFALKVLQILVPEVVSQNESECRELVRDLGCLPLALHVAAGVLRSEENMGWGVADLIEKIRTGTELINRMAPKNRIDKDGTIPSVKALLQRSTDVLDEHTRDYFICLGAFPAKPATFDLFALAAVWQVDDPKPIVRQLVGHGLLEPDGRGRFQMHRILVDHARSLCTEE
jgi:hypothetical protein